MNTNDYDHVPQGPRPAWMIEGASVEGGEGEDYDTGEIVKVHGTQITVNWASQIRTVQHWSALSEVSR